MGFKRSLLAASFFVAIAGVAQAQSVTTLNHVPNNAALAAVNNPGPLVRDGFYVAGDAPSITYYKSNGACTTPDNGAQVTSVDGKCWIATFPASGLDVREFGAKPSDTGTDYSTQFQNAINAAGASGQLINKVFVPAGVFKVTGLTESIANNVSIEGPAFGSDAGNAADLLASNLTGTVLEIDTVSGFSLKNIRFKSASNQTAGQYVYLNGAVNTQLKNITFLNGWNDGYCNNCNIMHWEGGTALGFKNTVFTVTGTPSNPIGDIDFSNINVDNPLVGGNSVYNPVVGCFQLTQTGGVTFHNDDFIHCHNGLVANPDGNNSQFVDWIYAVNTYWDTGDYPTSVTGHQTGGVGIKYIPINGGIVNGGEFANGWASTFTQDVLLQADNTSQINTPSFVNFLALNATDQGFYLKNVNGILMSNVTVAGASEEGTFTYSGIEFDTGVTGAILSNIYSGATQSFGATQKFGLQVDAGFTGTLKVGTSNLCGNHTAAWFNAATPGSFQIDIDAQCVAGVQTGSTGLVLGTATGGNEGAGTINAQNYYLNGSVLSGGGGGTVTSVVCPNGTITTTGNCLPLGAAGTAGDIITGSGTNNVQDPALASLTASGLTMAGATGGAQGVDTINAKSYYQQGSAITVIPFSSACTPPTCTYTLPGITDTIPGVGSAETVTASWTYNSGIAFPNGFGLNGVFGAHISNQTSPSNGGAWYSQYSDSSASDNNGAAFGFGTYGTFTGSSGILQGGIFDPTINQSGTAGYTGFNCAPAALTAVGTGEQACFKTAVGTTERSRIDINGISYSASSVPTFSGSCTVGAPTGGAASGKVVTSGVCTTQTVILTVPAGSKADNGYIGLLIDLTTPADAFTETANSTTSLTFTGTAGSGDTLLYKVEGGF